jgi:hypothetical protein
MKRCWPASAKVVYNQRLFDPLPAARPLFAPGPFA